MREASIERNTKETQISGSLAIEGTGNYEISTGVRFLDHMLELFSKHGGFRFDNLRQKATWMWTSTTQWKTPELCWAICSRKRWATVAESIARAISFRPWMKRWRWSRSIWADGRRWFTTSR